MSKKNPAIRKELAPMKNGFKKIAERMETIEIESPFRFEAPPYDQRSSSFVNAGQYHGVGHRQPVGHEDGAKDTAPCLPLSSKFIMDYQNRSLNSREVDID
jgi:hypothetical protein